MNSIRLIHDDAVSSLRAMESESVDMVLANPPIGIHVDERGRTEDWKFPPATWLIEALRVSRGPVVWTVSPLFLVHTLVDSLWENPDTILCWMIDKEKDYAPGRGFSSDFNLVCVHRPGSVRVASSDVFLAKPGLPATLVSDPVTEERAKHPAPGSFELAAKLCDIWKPRSILDPFCGPCASLEGALSSAQRGGWECEGIGIDIDMDYLDAAAAYFLARYGIKAACKSYHPATELRVGL